MHKYLCLHIFLPFNKSIQFPQIIWQPNKCIQGSNLPINNNSNAEEILGNYGPHKLRTCHRVIEQGQCSQQSHVCFKGKRLCCKDKIITSLSLQCRRILVSEVASECILIKRFKLRRGLGRDKNVSQGVGVRLPTFPPPPHPLFQANMVANLWFASSKTKTPAMQAKHPCITLHEVLEVETTWVQFSMLLCVH